MSSKLLREYIERLRKADARTAPMNGEEVRREAERIERSVEQKREEVNWHVDWEAEDKRVVDELMRKFGVQSEEFKKVILEAHRDGMNYVIGMMKPRTDALQAAMEEKVVDVMGLARRAVEAAEYWKGEGESKWAYAIFGLVGGVVIALVGERLGEWLGSLFR